jgi:hypothetical protein
MMITLFIMLISSSLFAFNYQEANRIEITYPRNAQYDILLFTPTKSSLEIEYKNILPQQNSVKKKSVGKNREILQKKNQELFKELNKMKADTKCYNIIKWLVIGKLDKKVFCKNKKALNLLRKHFQMVQMYLLETP